MWRVLVLLLIAPSAFAIPITPLPVYTDNHGREWIDVTHTAWRSWTEMLNVCDSATGYCSGVLDQGQGNPGSYAPAVDLTGFTWATNDDVRSMFYDLTGMPQGSLDSSVTFNGSGYGALVLNHFDDTISFQFTEIVSGLTRNVTFDPARGLVSGLFVVEHSAFGQDNFIVGGFPVGTADPSIGHFVYRVPEPGSLGLFGLGLLGLLVSTRARRAK